MRWSRTTTTLLLAAVLAVLGAACGEQVSIGSGAGALDGTAWELVEGVPMVEGYPITLRVDDGEVGGTAACNSYGGSVDVDGDRFVVGDIMQTEMGCPEEGVHDSEAAYLSALRSVERYEQPDDRLVLLGTDVELHFEPVEAVLTARPTLALDGRRLQLTAGERGLDDRAVE